MEALLEAVAASVAAAADSDSMSSWSEGAQDIASSSSTSGSTTATPAHRDPAPASESDVPPDAERRGTVTRRGRRSLAALQALAMMNRGDWAGAEAVASAAVAKDVRDAEAWSVLGHAQARHLGWVQVA